MVKIITYGKNGQRGWFWGDNGRCQAGVSLFLLLARDLAGEEGGRAVDLASAVEFDVDGGATSCAGVGVDGARGGEAREVHFGVIPEAQIEGYVEAIGLRVAFAPTTALPSAGTLLTWLANFCPADRRARLFRLPTPARRFLLGRRLRGLALE